jgi:hypothetical protein
MGTIVRHTGYRALVTSGLSVLGTQLRLAAGVLRDRVGPSVARATSALADQGAVAAFGPTAGAAVTDFEAAWRSELDAVYEAIAQLATAFEQVAAAYDATDSRAAERLATSVRAR